MKKIMYVFILVLLFSLVGCSHTAEPEPTYKIEMGVVSDSTYRTAYNMASSYGKNINHSNIKTIRDFLFQNTISNYDNSTKGVKTDEIRDFLMQRGYNEVQANSEIAVLETLGNDIMFFEYVYSKTDKVWIYAEKEN